MKAGALHRAAFPVVVFGAMLRVMQPLDTSPEAAAVQARIWREMTGSQRVELAVAMSEEAREVTAAGIQFGHPEYSDSEVRFALYRLLLGDALFRAAWPEAPVLDP
ncbi:MAG: hypothetical protein R3F39_05085 [Myxococcota bacterium]